jgi:hypothetical protein
MYLAEDVSVGKVKVKMGVRTKANKRLVRVLLERLVVWVWLRVRRENLLYTRYLNCLHGFLRQYFGGNWYWYFRC